MSAGNPADLSMVRGADFGAQIYWLSPDKVPFTVLSPMRMDIVSEVGQVVFTLATDDDIIEDENKTILYNSESGLIQLMIPASASKNFAVGVYSYDLWVTYQDNSITGTTRSTQLLVGNFYVEERVTKVV